MSFLPAEIVAIAGAFKDKAVTEAKAALPDGAVVPVDLYVRITGPVQKGYGTPDTVTTRPASCSLASLTVFCATLRRLGIGPKRLREALKELPALQALQVDAELTAVFDDVARSIAKKMPDERITVNGKRGSVSASVTVERA